MKKRSLQILMISVLAFSNWAAAQNTGPVDTSNTGIIRTENNLKTGNTLDVLTNFFQLAAQDLSGQHKSFAFKSTLFGIKARVDTTLVVDTNFRKLRHARNLQFEVALHTGDNFKPVGMSGGITYAIWNNRDKKRANFRNTDFQVKLDEYLVAKKNAESAFRKILRDSLNNKILPLINSTNARIAAETDRERKAVLNETLDSLIALKNEVRSAQSKLNNAANEFDRSGKLDGIPKDLRKAYEENKLPELREGANHVYDSLMEDIAARGLFTVGMNARTDSNTSSFNEGNLEIVYLKGIRGDRGWEADIRTDLNVKDTLTPDKNYRLTFSTVAGVNIIVFKSKWTHKSLFELKPNLEFRSILSKQYPDQNNYFSFNLGIRLRITDQIWLPVIVKYDPDNHNFLGLLNVSANLDALKNLLNSN